MRLRERISIIRVLLEAKTAVLLEGLLTARTYFDDRGWRHRRASVSLPAQKIFELLDAEDKAEVKKLEKNLRGRLGYYFSLYF